ncbi:hypothetical protein GGE07_006389 [Sinorhizobium terangae]|nr:hypothetical protein [Sinorhizobium terangae]
MAAVSVAALGLPAEVERVTAAVRRHGDNWLRDR